MSGLVLTNILVIGQLSSVDCFLVIVDDIFLLLEDQKKNFASREDTKDMRNGKDTKDSEVAKNSGGTGGSNVHGWSSAQEQGAKKQDWK